MSEYRSACDACKAPHVSALHRCGVPRTLMGKRMRQWAADAGQFNLIETIDRIELDLHREAITSGTVVPVMLGAGNDGGTYAYLPRNPVLARRADEA